MNEEMTKGERTKSRIIEEALNILSGEGFKALNIDNIARRSNISKTMFYRYFASKEKLLDAIREHKMNPTEVITQRDEILKRASQAFFKLGSEEIDMDSIARASGINRASLYRYFSSKEELLEYAVLYEIKNRQNILSDIKNKTDDPVEQFSMMLELTCNPSHQHFDTLMMVTSRYKLYKNEKIKEYFNTLIQDTIHTIADIFQDGIQKGVFREDIDTHMTAIMLLSLFHGIIFNHEYDLKNDVNQIKQYAYDLIVKFTKKE